MSLEMHSTSGACGRRACSCPGSSGSEFDRHAATGRGPCPASPRAAHPGVDHGVIRECCRYGNPAARRGDGARRPRTGLKCSAKLRSTSTQSINPTSRTSGYFRLFCSSSPDRNLSGAGDCRDLDPSNPRQNLHETPPRGDEMQTQFGDLPLLPNNFPSCASFIEDRLGLLAAK